MTPSPSTQTATSGPMDRNDAEWADCAERQDESERCKAKSDISCRKHLVRALRDAAELEHYLMCMYLYAAFSLKKSPDATCGKAQLEPVRRWANQFYMIARQEMEHLALVNGLLAAIGGPAHFLLEDEFSDTVGYHFGLQVGRGADAVGHEPKSFALSLKPFSEDTISAFTCLESPGWDSVKGAELCPCWCFENGTEAPRNGATGLRPAKRHLEFAFEQADRAREAGTEVFEDSAGPGTVAELYAAIRQAFERIPGRVLFSRQRPQPEILAQYDVFVFPVTDLASALTAIRLIIDQGEGNLKDVSITSHFGCFFGIRKDLLCMVRRDSNFEPALPLLCNPKSDDIENGFTREVFELAEYSYNTMLLVLTSIYDDYVPPASNKYRYPYLSETLHEMVFAPLMTMVIRAQADLLVRLPACDTEHPTRSGPGFKIDDEVRELLGRQRDCGPQNELRDIDYFIKRFDLMVERLDVLTDREKWQDWVPEADRDSVFRDVTFMYQNVYRMTNNLRRTYQVGRFEKF